MLDPTVVWGSVAAAVSGLFGALMAFIYFTINDVRAQRDFVRDKVVTLAEAEARATAAQDAKIDRILETLGRLEAAR